MVMKDKLVKTNHKASYYFMKKASVVALAVVCGAFAIAVPTYIIQNSAKNTTALAEENKEEENKNENGGEDTTVYESYHY